MTPKLSIYFYLFNAHVYQFDIARTVKNFCDFADEVVCATIKDQKDHTLDSLRAEELKYPGKFKVVVTDIKLSNNRFDGDLKTAALQTCARSTPSEPRAYIIADADERFLIRQKNQWLDAAAQLFQYPRLDGWLIPVVDLYGDEQHIKDAEIGQKFRMHKNTVVRRGVNRSAEMDNGKFRTDLSDSTEPLNSNDDLALFMSFVRPDYLHPQFTSALNNHIYVVHYGFLDLARRAKLGAEFWKEKWEDRSGRQENVATTVEALELTKTVKHRLNLS